MKIVGMQIGNVSRKESYFEGVPANETPNRGFAYRPAASYKASGFNVMTGEMGRERTVKEPERVVFQMRTWHFARGTVMLLRRVTPEYEARLNALDAEMARLAAERRELVAEAYRYGETVKAAEARTWVKPKEVKSEPTAQ